MCGITGIVSPTPADPDVSAACARKMADTLYHRGPDGEGTWSDEFAALGHRRLSIIDVADGAQPMRSERGCVITYNGEIYNYLEIRKELADAGIKFLTRSDTEVALRAFEHWGAACVERFNGMFALAIWDPEQRRLFLARDRLGKKPLYYAFGAEGFAFASEIKALRALPWVTDAGSIDAAALSDYVTLGYILTPKTIYRNIRTLPPASYTFVTPGDPDLAPTDYWPLHEHVRDTPIPYDFRAQDRFSELLEDAVALRLRADVPVGLYLSGGLDSAAIAATAASLRQSRIEAFTLSFEEESFDESAAARRTADYLGMPINVMPPQPIGESLVADLVRQADQPFADTSSGPTFLLNQAASAHVKVALSGDGGDEILAGYPTYRADQLQLAYGKLPRCFGRALRHAVTLLMRPSYRKLSTYYKLRQFAAAAGMEREEAHYWWRVIFSDDEKCELLSPTLLAEAGGYHPMDKFQQLFHVADGGAADFLRRSQYVDIKTWLLDDILVKADRFSMAHSVEVRSPFLDHRLVEFCLRLEGRGKISASRQKTILRDTMKTRLPKDVFARAKAGFGAPTKQLNVAQPLPTGVGVLNPDFRLDPVRDDVTYKSFSLAILNSWLDS